MTPNHQQADPPVDPAAEPAVPAARSRAGRRIAGCVLLGAVLVLFHFAQKHGRTVSERRERGAEAYMLSMLLRESYRNNGGIFPAWDSQAGDLFYDPASVNPAYRLDQPLNRLLIGDINNQMGFILGSWPDRSRYVYLPYAVTNESEGLALQDAFRTAIRSGEAFESTLSATPGQGTCGSDRFYRIGSDLQKNLQADGVTIPDGIDLARHVPVIFERPDRSQNTGAWGVPINRQPVWVPYPGPFPMTERVMEAVAALEEESQPRAPDEATRP